MLKKLVVSLFFLVLIGFFAGFIYLLQQWQGFGGSLDDMRTQLSAKDRTITDLYGQIEEYDNQKNDLTAQIVSLDQASSEKDASIAELDGVISEQDATLTERWDLINKLKQNLDVQRVGMQAREWIEFIDRADYEKAYARFSNGIDDAPGSFVLSEFRVYYAANIGRIRIKSLDVVTRAPSEITNDLVVSAVVDVITPSRLAQAQAKLEETLAAKASGGGDGAVGEAGADGEADGSSEGSPDGSAGGGSAGADMSGSSGADGEGSGSDSDSASGSDSGSGSGQNAVGPTPAANSGVTSGAVSGGNSGETPDGNPAETPKSTPNSASTPSSTSSPDSAPDSAPNSTSAPGETQETEGASGGVNPQNDPLSDADGILEPGQDATARPSPEETDEPAAPTDISSRLWGLALDPNITYAEEEEPGIFVNGENQLFFLINYKKEANDWEIVKVVQKL